MYIHYRFYNYTYVIYLYKRKTKSMYIHYLFYNYTYMSLHFVLLFFLLEMNKYEFEFEFEFEFVIMDMGPLKIK